MAARQEPQSLRVLADTYPGSRSDSAVRSDYFPDVRPGKRRPPREADRPGSLPDELQHCKEPHL
ncbi:hypothetical protein GCM10010095_49570 [Streptomyces anthocyanicus]|uniref:Uncharacterized protein n=1 Tax=Streptomyces violaceolatus TaxID=67378 RepID=A0ABN3TAJ4_9ACTN|nr:predicted protein [Streptomyces lividans TK24]BDD72687.1 hypothetical protein JCM4020_33070 [Streptomyces coelicolor]BDE39899.1 hypothetical protein SLITK23_31440 [Streptomyces lividans]GGL58526.1 hypothetical protein GCM10010095_49570 [Streptomyces anthocyanicus]GHA49665.1 hypothetical protein GCM10010391_37920 [Streptomyces anthocyanicus]